MKSLGQKRRWRVHMCGVPAVARGAGGARGAAAAAAGGGAGGAVRGSGHWRDCRLPNCRVPAAAPSASHPAIWPLAYRGAGGGDCGSSDICANNRKAAPPQNRISRYKSPSRHMSALPHLHARRKAVRPARHTHQKRPHTQRPPVPQATLSSYPHQAGGPHACHRQCHQLGSFRRR